MLGIKTPILMYHEVSESGHSSVGNMTPAYDIPSSLFESHIQGLVNAGYNSLLLDDIANIQRNQNYVIITFDDGLIGNYRHAAPILKKYNFKAIIFIAVDRIGTSRFMDWPELRELVAQGSISIQSHTMSHRPLQTLSSKEIVEELSVSKKTIEEKLSTTVSAISFPHGSYNSNTISLAKEAGYRYLCTSDIKPVYSHSFNVNPSVLGRVAVTSKMDAEKILNMVAYDYNTMLSLKLSKSSKNVLKKIVGIDNYRKLYRSIFKIHIAKE